MRHRIVVAYILLLHVALAAMVLSPSLPGRLWRKVFSDDGGLPAHPCYAGMVAVQERMAPAIPVGSVLFLGDSLMQGLCVDAVTRDGVNLGIGGDTVRGLLRRIAGIEAVRHARGVFILVGHNDLAREDGGGFGVAYGRLLARIPSSVPVAACAIPVVDERLVRYTTNAQIAAFNVNIKAQCDMRPGCVFVPLPEEMEDGNGNLEASFHDGDGVHLNAAGYRPLIEAMRRVSFR